MDYNEYLRKNNSFFIDLNAFESITGSGLEISFDAD